MKGNFLGGVTKTLFAIVLVFFSVSHFAFAQATTVSSPTNISGLVSCISLTFTQATFTENSCGDAPTTSGSFLIGDSDAGNQVPYNAGDIIKCEYTRATSSASCVVTHANKTSNNYNTTFLTSALSTSAVDAKGVVTAATSESGVAAIDKTVSGAGTAGKCSIDPSDWGNCLLDAVSGFIFTLANLILAESGMVLNFVIVKTIFQFSTLIGNSPGLLVGWGILRDIGNMVLLFGFIFIGISTILERSTYSYKKTLPTLLLYAVLLNFSLFAAEAVIDTSNVFATVMYSQANTDTCAGFTSGDATQTREDCAKNYGLAGHIMQSTGLSSIFAVNSQKFDPVILIGLAIMAIIGSVVFMATAIMLTIRAVVLTFVMVASPIGFAGAAIPALSGFSKIWWKYLLREAFFAPVLLLLIFISLKITDTFSKGGSLGAALATANTSTIGVIFIFVLIIAFLLGSLAAAKKLGATGSSMAVKGGGKLAFGVTAAVGRRTVGRASGAAAKYIRKSPISTSFAGRTLAGVADKGAASSFDFRATKAAGALSKSTKLDFGKPQKGGYDAIVKKGVDDRIKYAESLKQSDAEKAEATALIDANKKIQEQKEKAEKTLTDSTKNVESANTRDTATLNRTNRTQDVVKTVYEEEVADRNARILSALGRADVETQTKEREDLKKVVEKYEADSRRIEAEKKALVDAIRERTAAQEKNVEELTTKIQETDAQLKQNNTRLNGEEKDGVLVKAGIGPDAKKAFYADKMVRGFNITSNPFGNSGNARPSASGRARREAAAKIRSGLKKTSDQKLIDAFKAELLKEDKKPEKAEEAAPAT